MRRFGGASPRRSIGRRLLAPLMAAAVLGGCGNTPPQPPVTGSPASPGSPGPSASGPETSPGAASSVAPIPEQVRPIGWSDCGSGFECGQVLVPRDYAAVGGPSLIVSVIRLPALDRTHRIGSLVVNPGGPGASRSSEVRCVDDLDHFLAVDSAPDTQAELATLLDGERAFAEGCQRRNADLLPVLGTENVARDLDRLRVALGDDKLTYVGFSYGTLIGALYAQMFPDRIRALVLDGAVDPSLDLAALSEGQAVGFEAALGRFLADCARNRSCPFHHGGRPGPAFDRLIARIEAKPLPATRLRDSRLVGPGYAWNGLAAASYRARPRRDRRWVVLPVAGGSPQRAQLRWRVFQPHRRPPSRCLPRLPVAAGSGGLRGPGQGLEPGGASLRGAPRLQ